MLACGLPEKSRAKMKISGQRFTFEQDMLINIYDLMRVLVWLNSADGAKNRNRPVPYRDRLAEQERKEDRRLRGFDSPDKLMTYLERARRC